MRLLFFERELEQLRLFHRLAHIRCPTLLIAGVDDLITPACGYGGYRRGHNAGSSLAKLRECPRNRGDEHPRSTTSLLQIYHSRLEKSLACPELPCDISTNS
jgi:pimeloyl-ACP methyl ester carboxylesterase